VSPIAPVVTQAAVGAGPSAVGPAAAGTQTPTARQRSRYARYDVAFSTVGMVLGVRWGLRNPRRLTVLAIAGDAPMAVFWVLRVARAVQRRRPRIAAGCPACCGHPRSRRCALVEVRSLYCTDTAPVYFPHPRHGVVALAVELPETTAWVLHGTESSESVRDFLFTMLEGVAYWIWQLGQAQPGLLTGAAGPDRQLRITVTADDSTKWSQLLAGGIRAPLAIRQAGVLAVSESAAAPPGATAGLPDLICAPPRTEPNRSAPVRA
jgi:hypothetical protein